MMGSPPRVWGQRRTWFPVTRPPRFTPTRVGTTRRVNLGRTLSTVHPHACGDNARTTSTERRDSGSPPRVWGQQARRLLHVHEQRFTPTRVGTTRERAGLQHLRHRFTPTRVGTTTGIPACRPRRSVHPHACGDNSSSAGASAATVGSPPRVWGQLRGRSEKTAAARFTPTRVGTTCSASSMPSALKVHPHACGDNVSRLAMMLWRGGSPPRVWGQPAFAPAPARPARFTPTRVGTTRTCAHPGQPQTVHPHACGDNGGSFALSRSSNGSPPRVWGQHHRAVGVARPIRFTPTRVGTT